MSSTPRPRTTRDDDSIGLIARWLRRIGLPLTFLGWTAVGLIVLWLAGHIIRTLFLLTIAALIAYALAPVVAFFERRAPRILALAITYLLVLGAFGALLYLVTSTAIEQFRSLAGYVRALLTPSATGQLTPLEQTLASFGISQDQIA